MRKLNVRLTVVLFLGLVLGVAMQVVRLQRACAIPTSEACVWGQAYLPLSLLLGALFGLGFGGFVYVMASILFRGRSRRPDAR